MEKYLVYIKDKKGQVKVIHVCHTQEEVENIVAQWKALKKKGSITIK